MRDHEWCRDTARDEAIRAAEDAAAVPSIQHRDLPEIVAELRERVAELTTKHNALADLARLDAGWLKANEQRLTAERDAARARVAELEAAQATLGSEDVFRDVGCGSTGDEIARLTAERDAAIRERDEAQSEAAGLRSRLEAESAPGLRSLAKNLRDKLRSCESALKRVEGERDAALADVAALQRERDDALLVLPACCGRLSDAAATVVQERDAAQSQCEELERAALVDHETIGTLLARVAELEAASCAAGGEVE